MPTKKHANAAPENGEAKPKRKYTRTRPAGGGVRGLSAFRQADDITITLSGPFAQRFMNGLITGALGEYKSQVGQLGGVSTHLGPENV